MSETTHSFICVTWNVRNLLNKRLEIESLLFRKDIDALALVETWLTSKIKEWHVKGSDSKGGGTLTLIKDSIKVEHLNIRGSWDQHMEVTGVKLGPLIGSIYLISVYVPPNSACTIPH